MLSAAAGRATRPAERALDAGVDEQGSVVGLDPAPVGAADRVSAAEDEVDGVFLEGDGVVLDEEVGDGGGVEELAEFDAGLDRARDGRRPELVVELSERLESAREVDDVGLTALASW